MRIRTIHASAVIGLALGVQGCSGSGSGGGGGAGPICAKNTFQLVGTFDGAAANGAYGGPGTYLFANALGASSPGTLDLQFGTGGTLHLTWTTLAADDQTVAASGTVTMPSEGPHPSQAYCVSAGTITPRSDGEGGGVSFAFTTMGAGACPAAAVASGSLQGCASPSN